MCDFEIIFAFFQINLNRSLTDSVVNSTKKTTLQIYEHVPSSHCCNQYTQRNSKPKVHDEYNLL